MSYIITDTEYTTWPGALESGWAERWQHREIFQLGAIKTNDRFDVLASLLVYVVPSINSELSQLSQQLTGVSQLQLIEFGTTFPDALTRFVNFAGANPRIICMNGDSAVFRENCEINGIPFPFERDFHRLRPLLEQRGIDLSDNSSGDLHRLTPTPIIGHTHDALHDCRSMSVWLKHACEQGIFASLDQLPVEVPKIDPRSRKPGLQR
jgi:inhibitor of KinA sporulation pathway (predicted exonuclease)